MMYVTEQDTDYVECKLVAAPSTRLPLGERLFQLRETMRRETAFAHKHRRQYAKWLVEVDTWTGVSSASSSDTVAVARVDDHRSCSSMSVHDNMLMQMAVRTTAHGHFGSHFDDNLDICVTNSSFFLVVVETTRLFYADRMSSDALDPDTLYDGLRRWFDGVPTHRAFRLQLCPPSLDDMEVTYLMTGHYDDAVDRDTDVPLDDVVLRLRDNIPAYDQLNCLEFTLFLTQDATKIKK